MAFTVVPVSRMLSSFRRHPLFVAFACVVVAWALRTAIDPIAGDTVPYPMFLIAIVVTALYADTRATFVAALVGSVVAKLCFVPPRYHLTFHGMEEVVGLLQYIFAAAAIVWLSKYRSDAW